MARWKPNAAQKAAYKAKIAERDQIKTITSNGPIRTGCYVEYYSFAKGMVITGNVVKHSYGSKTNQHTFTIDSKIYGKVNVKGRNLYPNLQKHTPGKESINHIKK